MKVNGFWKKTLCLVLAMAMVLGNASPVVAAHEHETAAEIVTEITNATIKEAEKLIDKTGLMNAADVTDTKNALEEADSNLAGSMGNLGTVVEDAQAAIDELEGKVTKDDATKINASLSVAYGEASSAWENAVAVSDAAVADLEKAAEAYESASQISDEAAKIAEAELKAAQEALNAAVEATKFANDNMVSLQNEFAKATELATKWSTEVETALAEATAKFEEAQAALNSALEALGTEDADFRAAIDEFKVCYDAFIEAANAFKASIDTAVAAQEALDALYAEYEAVKSEYEAVKVEYDAMCEANVIEGYPADYEAFKALVKDLVTLDENIKLAKENYDKYQDDEYEALMSAQKDILADGQKSSTEKEDAAKEIARLIIVKELLKEGQTVEEADVVSGEYGKADKNFFVVLDAESKVVARYTYAYDANADVVNLFAMKSDKDYVIYKGTYYELLVEDGNYYIETEDSGRVDVFVENGAEYYELVTIDKTERPDKTVFPEQVNTTFAEELGFIDDIEGYINDILKWIPGADPISITIPGDVKTEEVTVEGDGEKRNQYYVDYNINYGVGEYYIRYDISLTQDEQTGEYSASYDYTEEVDEQLDECLNPNHDVNHDANRDICINETHNASEKNLHDIDGNPQCTNEKHNASEENLHDVDGKPQCTNESHNTSEENLHDVDGVPVCSNVNHINKVHEHDPNGTICVDPLHLANPSLHDPNGDKCIDSEHYINGIHYNYTISTENGTAGYTCSGWCGSGLGSRYHVSHFVGDDGVVYGQYYNLKNKLVTDTKNTHEMKVCDTKCDYNACDYDKCEAKNPCTHNPCTYDPCTYTKSGKCIAQKSEPVEIIYTTFIPQAVYVMEDGSKLECDVTVPATGDSFITVCNEKIPVTLTEDGEHYTYKVSMTYVSEGEIFEVNNNITVEENSNTYDSKKSDYETSYEEALKAWKDKVGADYYEGVYDIYVEKLATLEEVYNSYSDKKAAFEEKDLGELANLPKNISEMVEGMEVEEMLTLLEAIVELSSQSDDVDYEAVLEVLSDVLDTDAAGRLIAVLAYDALANVVMPTSAWDDFLGGAGDIIDKVEGALGDIIDQITPPTAFEVAYANTWVDALTTKIAVVQSAIELVEIAVDTVEAGVTAVTEGVELGEVAVDAVLATAEKKMLEATVDVLVMANDVMNSSEEVVLSIDNIISTAQSVTEAAYLAAVAESNALNQVTITKPYATKLDETLVAIGAANALKSDLSADIALAEVSIATAKELYEELKVLEEHEHTYLSKKTDATCTEDGSIVHVCTICTYTYTETVGKTGHTYDTVVTAPTCTKEGYTTYTCACSYSYVGDKVEALGHNYESKVTNPNCTEGGYTTYTCKACGDSYVDDEVTATGHTYVTEEKAATCTEDGYITYACACGDTSTVVIPALGHDTTTETVAATCEVAGSVTTTCIRSGCTYEKVDTIDPLEHDLTTETVAATCEVAGSVTTACTRSGCTYEKVDTIDPLEHDITTETVDATCTTDGLETTKCTRSGCVYKVEKILASTGHSHNETTEEATCTEDGKTTYTCACGDTFFEIIPALKHDYEKVVTDPTCTTPGKTTYTCKRVECTDSYITDEKESLGHSLESVVTAPTCTTDGYTTHTCARTGCDLSYKDTTVTAPGHDWGEWEVTKPATDTEFGEEIRYCKVEGCEGSETREINPSDHEHVLYVLEKKDATCTESGYTIYACGKCNQKNTTDIKAALGHSYGEWTVKEAATCTGAGSEVRVCERCNNATEEQTISAKGHAWGEWKVTTPVTELVNGLETRACSACNTIEENIIPAPGHEYVVTAVVEPTCTERGYTTYTCTHSECNNDSYNADYVDALGHSETAVVTAPTCEADGYTTYTCSRCGESRTADATSVLGHDYVPTVTAPTCEADGYTTYTCSRCDSSYVADEVAALGHSFGEWTVEEAATCTKEGREAQICVTCGEKVTRAIVALGHSFGEWTVTEAATCTVAGTEVRTCTLCDLDENRAIDALGHTYEAVVTAPTCTEEGYTTYTCSVCGNSYVADEVAATGHSYTATDFEATCTEGGYTGYECECGVYIVGNMTDALGHAWGDWTVTTAATETTTGVETRECATCHATETNTLARLTAAPVADDVEDEVVIEDEETPLAGGEVEDEVIIEDEETPLASGELKVEIAVNEEVVAKAEEQVNALVEQIIAGETVSETAVSEETVAKITEAVANDEEIIVKVVAEVIEETVVPTEDKEQVKETVEELTVIDVEDVVIVQFIDIAVEIYTSSGEKLGNYNELPEKLTFTVSIPEGMDTEGKTFVIIRVHNGEVTILDTVMNEDGTLSFETDKFSTYAIAYRESVNKVDIEEVEIPLTNGNSNFGLIFALVGALAVLGTGAMVAVSQRKKSSSR